MQIDKVAARKEISQKQLEGDISEGLRRGVKGEMGTVNKRWGPSREADSKKSKRPLITSQEWEDVQTGTEEGVPPVKWYEWLNKRKEEQWELLASLGS